MLQHAVALLLQRLLGKFVTFDSSMLKLSLWQGDLSFRDLQLRLSYGEGAIGFLSVKIPWRALWTQPVQIKAQGVRVWLHQTPKTIHTEPQDAQEAVDTSIEDGHGDDRTYLSKLVSHIIGNVQIEVSDVQVRYDCDPSSLAPRPGSGTLEVGYVSVINANADWQLEFTPQSNVAMKSNKLLKVEGVAAYVEYPDKESRRRSDCGQVSPDIYRKYLFHEWRSTVKASLYYHSNNAAFPDVELDVDIGCGPGNVAEKCSICAAHNTCGTKKFVLPANQPRVHFGPEHVDVLYAILIEVRAPYDEYDRLTVLTRQQASRPDGFLMVLSYAKQWLLTDCLDAVVEETFTLEAEDEDDDDDEFEDAITPPSLSVRAQLRHGAGLFFSARESIATESEVIREAQWIWVLGETIAAVKQSCVEDEIQLSIQSLRMYEVAERSGSYSIIDHASENCEDADSALVETPIVRMSCVIPAYQSRLIGYQPVLDIRLGGIMMFIKDETLLVWMTLFAPVYLWWNRWNLSHPSTLGACDEDWFAPISHLGIHVEKICLVYALQDQFCFGAELKVLSVVTSESDHEFVQSVFRSGIRLFSARENLTSLQSQTHLNDVKGVHNIATVDDLSLTTTSHSRMHWSMDHYFCKHCALRDGRLHYEQRELDSNEESAVYRYEAGLSTVEIDWTVSELEAIAWILGKWSFFMPDEAVVRPVPSPNHTVANSEVILICHTKWSIRTPEIQICITEDRKGQDAKPSFTLSIKDVEWLSRTCTTTSYQSIRVASISLREGDTETIQVTGKLGLCTPAFRVTFRCDRGYPCKSRAAGKSVQGVLQSDRQSTRVVFIIERLHGELFLPNIQVILAWLGDCYDRYLLGFILSTNAGYALDDFRRNLSKLGSEASLKSLKDSSCSSHEVFVSLWVTHGLQLKVRHLDQTRGVTFEGLTPVQTIARIKVSSVYVQVSGSCAACGTVIEVKGSLRNLQLTDLTSPSGSLPARAKQSNRQSIGSPADVLDGVADAGSVGVKNLIDFVINFPGRTDNRVMVRLRLDSVCIVYLHRVFKQFYHYIFDHVFEILRNPLSECPSLEKASSVFESFGVDATALSVSLHELLHMYADAVVIESNHEAGAKETAKSELRNACFEVVGNDLVFALPRSSFSRDSIILRSTNARFWSSCVDPSTSDFLQNGTFADETRFPDGPTYAGGSAAKAQLHERTELRNLRRQIKNQRSRFLSNRSQLYLDLRSATQQAQNYLHEDFLALPAAENAVKIIHNKIVQLNQQLELLTQYLGKVDDAIDGAVTEGDAHNGGDRDSLQFVARIPKNDSRARSDSMKQVRLDVASMSQHLMAPLFGAEDAEFHDARVASGSNVVSPDCGDTDMSTSSLGLFEFELIDLSGTTRDSMSQLFHHSLLTGRIDVEPESLYEATLSTYFGISVSMNEFSVETGPEQYAILLGVIYENVGEVSRVVREDTCPSCATCRGLHDSSEYCNAIWLKVLVKVADAALRVSSIAYPIADLLWEQLELTFILRTDDSLEVNATALTFTAVDVRPMHCQASSEVVRPLAGDGPQFEYSQKMTWTDAVYDLKVRNANFLGVYPAYHDIVAFFVTPFFTEGEYLDFDVGFMPPPPPDWQKVDFFISTTGCFFSLLEDFEYADARALVILTDVVVAYSGLQKCEGMTDMTKCHLEFDQHGIYFSQLPDLQIDASFPLSNSFLLVVDHFVEAMTTLSRRNSFVLAPVETRFSVQDANLFIDIVNNYLQWIPPPSPSAPIRNSPNGAESGSSGASSVPAVLVTPHYAADKLLGDVGELRLVLVNNSLGIPIADLHMQDIVCEYIQDEDYSTTMGTTLLLNYFNNSIYRWEPLVEPFVVQMRIRRALEENSLIEVFANLPTTVNFNMTPAMAPLLSSEALTRADFVTSGSKSTAPFWVENKTGSELTFSFRRGTGSIIQQVVADNRKVSVDCREQGDMLNFDSASADRFLRETDRQALTVNHTLSVWLNGNKWVSVNPVVVDMVGHVAVPLRETPSHDDSDGFEISEDEEITPPTLVAEISIQADGSKLISLHSQVVLQNRTSVPLMVWAYSPRDGGCTQEWVIDREQICHIPLQLVHPQSKVSIRPSPYVQYAPLTTSLEELGDEVRAAKTINTKRFVRAGNCTCSFETFSTTDESQYAADSLEVVSSSSLSSAVPLSGYIARDLPTWKCTYEVEAYFLMRATFSRTEEPSPAEEVVGYLSHVEEEGDKVEDDFLHVFGPPARCQRITPRRDASYGLNEARSASQRRGLYEATNSSLYYLSVSPFLTLHNRLATAMAYRLLNDSLQLIAEGVLAVGNVLPLFQINSSEVLFVSFRLENYSWSAPRLIINPKTSTYSIPYKETTEPVQLVGRTFDRDIAGEQSNVPNLQLQVKLSGRDVVVFCSIWIVNHTDLDLEYCNSTSSSSKRLENVLKYVHRRPASVEKQNEYLLTRSVSFRNGGARETPLTCLRKVKPSTIPVAVIVVIREARELYNAQYFGSQSPYVRVSLFALKDPKDMYLEKPEMVAVCSATTKPSPSGGLTPQWDDRLQNTLLLRFPPELRTLDLARIIIEVRNVHYGLDTCLGVTAVKVDSILKDRKRAAAFNWYKLLKRKSSREQKKSKNKLASIHRGDISISFSVGMSQELPTDLDVVESTEAITDDYGSLSICDEEMIAPYLERQESKDFQLDDVDSFSVLEEQQTPCPLPSARATRSLQRLKTPSNHDIRLIGVPASVRGRPVRTFTGELEATRPQESLSYDPISTRDIGAMLLNGASPIKPVRERKSHGLQVYLPHNRFACVVVEVDSTSLMSEVFDSVCIKCGFDGVLNIDDFDFYELVLPRFVSLRSAGRPEGERWYGQPIPMTSRTENRGRRHGFHLCHKIAITTIRLYDEASTASSHHVTPRSLATSSKRSNPAQIRPVPWSDVLPYSSGGKYWDVLRIKSRSSPWSDTIRLNRNAMGNSGVAQVISLTNEVRDQDKESDLRNESLEVALWSCFGSGRFSETIIATVVPRYILINKTEETIKFRQCGVPRTMRLAANELVPFHWPSALQEKLLEVTLLHKYSWSGSFRINSLGTTYLKLRDRDHPSRIYILVCQIELVGGSVALVFRGESRRFPPYRIDNMTSFRIQYKQTNWGGDSDFDELLPRSSCPYSWDYLHGTEGKSSSSTQEHVFPGNSNSSSRSLRVKFMRVTSSTSKTGEISDKDAVEVREYNLDEMATYKRIQLHRSLPSEIFFKPEQKGYLLKKDSMLKWNRKYFRLYEHMLYYFANETDQELLGVVDLRTGSNVPGVGSVAIFEKAPEAPSKTGFISLNGLVSSISDSIFGKDSKQLGNDGGDDDDDDSEDRLRELVHFAVSLTASSLLREESEKFVNGIAESRTAVALQKGIYVNGQDLVNHLMTEMNTHTKTHVLATAQEMMELGLLSPVNTSKDRSARRQAPMRSFQCSRTVWYSVNPTNSSGDSDLDSGHCLSTSSRRDGESPASSNNPSAKPAVVGSNQFSIITPTKCYDLKARTPKIAKMWVRRLRLAIRSDQPGDIEEFSEDAPRPQTTRSQWDLAPQVQNSKTYVFVRIRADGPTKVLELFEGGEEDFDEKETKYELSSTASASSDSPIASETSTGAFGSLTSGVALRLRVDGIGVSCVNEFPMELVYIYLGGISLQYSRLNSNMRMNVTLDDLQIDNQSEEATFTKLLCPRLENNAAAAPTPTKRRSVGDIDAGFAEMVSRGTRGENVGNVDNGEQVNTGLILSQNIFSCADCKYRQTSIAAMHFCCTWSNEQGNTDYFKHCSFWLYPVITQLDEDLLVSARAFMKTMSQSSGQNRSQNRGGEIRTKTIPIEMMLESLTEYRENTRSDELDPLKSLESYTTTSSSETRKVYFALLHIHPVDIDITFRSDVFQASAATSLHERASSKMSKIGGSFAEERKRSSSASSACGESSCDDSSSMTWAFPSLTMHVPDLDNAPVRLNALMIEHAFGTSGDLTRRVSKYYTRQLWKQLHKILGSFDFLGNPVGFLDHIGTGVRDFVYEPLEGLKIGGKGFSKGLAKGTASLMSNTVDGTFDAASKISGTFGQGFANLSLDDRYQQNRARARRHHVRGLREGLMQGSRELSLGVYEGVSGLMLNPMRGVHESGALGFVRGTITGIIGLPVKPVAGLFDFASRTTQGVRNRSLQNGQNMGRVRRPRVFGRYNELKCYKEADAIAYELLKRVGGDRLSSEKIVFYNEILQSVRAADLTREARDRRHSSRAGNGKSMSNNDSTRERTNSLRRTLQESAERRRAAGEPPNVSTSEAGGRKLRYEVVFHQKKLGMDLETDFYGENVTIKAMDEAARSKVKVCGLVAPRQKVLQEGDCLIGVGGVDVRNIGFHETLALLRGTARPIAVQFESAEELMEDIASSELGHPDSGGVEVSATSKARLRRLSLADSEVENEMDESIQKIKVQLTHWLIVTEQRVLYINVGSYTNPVVEWMTPLRYIYRVERQKNAARILLHLSVGVDSLPMGPRLRPLLKTIDSHARDMNVFLDVMWHSFGSATAEEQELWPSDTSLNGYLLKKGGFSTVRRWFVLSRNCLYYFSNRKQLRGIIPLGHVRLETDAGDARCLRIKNATRSQPLITLQLDSGQVVERVQSEVVLMAASTQELEMWQSSIAHAAGKGMRHSRGTRFFVPTAASRLEVGTRETPDFVVQPLVEALTKTVEVFNPQPR